MVKGNIVLNNGEQLEGRIVVQHLEDMAQKIVFYGDLNIKYTYGPDQIKLFSLNYATRNEEGEVQKTWKHFESKGVHPASTSKVFMEKKASGTLSLYTFYTNEIPKNSSVNYRLFIEGNTLPFMEIIEKEFNKTAKQIFREYEELTYAIGEIEGYSYVDMDRLVQNYNAWLIRQ